MSPHALAVIAGFIAIGIAVWLDVRWIRKVDPDFFR